MASDNKSLGRFILDGIPPAPRGMPQVEVTFDVDANGILNVKAKDKASGKEQSIRIEAGTGLSKEEVEKMQKEALANAAEDEKKKALVDAKNTAEQLIYTSEKALKDLPAGEAGAPNLPEDIKTSVNTKIEALKKEKDSGTADSIKGATEELSTEIQKIGEYLNKNQQRTTNDSQQEGPDVKDAEYKEKPDDETKASS